MYIVHCSFHVQWDFGQKYQSKCEDLRLPLCTFRNKVKSVICLYLLYNFSIGRFNAMNKMHFFKSQKDKFMYKNKNTQLQDTLITTLQQE